MTLEHVYDGKGNRTDELFFGEEQREVMNRFIDSLSDYECEELFKDDTGEWGDDFNSFILEAISWDF